MEDYQIRRSDGSVFATIPNQVILGPNQPSGNPVPINLLGRNKVGFGQATNENFLHLAENFASGKAPKGNIKGQLWYKNTSGPGEMLIALKDGARQPVDAATEADWATLPMITLFNTVPDGTNSNMGRMVLTNNGDSLRVLMKDKEWREIQTIRPQNKEFESLLDINYDTNVKYISFTQSNSTKPVAYFNIGGASIVDPDGYTVFQSGDGVFQFGGNYFYEMRIMAREVQDNNTVVVPVPTNYKTWIVRGQFYVNNKQEIVNGTVQAQNIPDPRRIANLSSNTDIIDSTRDNWNVNVVINGIDPSIAGATSTTKAGYEQWVLNTLNSPKHLGLRIDGNITGLASTQSTLTQWSVLIKMTGIPPVGV